MDGTIQVGHVNGVVLHPNEEIQQPVVIHPAVEEVLQDERLNIGRKLHADLPDAFQIEALDTRYVFSRNETIPAEYDRMMVITARMQRVALAYRRAVNANSIHDMENLYDEALALKEQFYNPVEAMANAQQNGGDADLPPAPENVPEQKMGYFAKKKADKKAKKDKEKRVKQLESQYGERYASYAKVKENQVIDSSFMQNDYVREVVLAKKTVYKDEQGKKVEITQRALLENVMHQDYSRLEQLEPALRNMLAAQFMRDNANRFTGDAAQDAVTLSTAFPGGLMQPLLRLGISLGMRSSLSGRQQEPEYYKRLDAQMNAMIMQKTLSPFRHHDRVGAGRDFSQEDVTRNAQSQMFIAKTMLMCHMGTFALKNKEDVRPWDGPVANAFAHCSRVGIVLPGMRADSYSEQGEKRIIDSYTGRGGGLEAGFFKRGGATHTLFRKSKENGLVKTGFKELKMFSPFHQRGMNVAVGGLGNNGITGPGGTERILKNDGSCGHIYMHLEEGDGSNYTSMLVGFESDSYKKTNQLGHTHGFGNGEFASSFGGQRLDEIGDKYGGRRLDLTNINSDIFNTVMQKFETSYAHLQERAAENDADMATLEEMNKKLCGARMSREELRDFIRQYMNEGPDMSDADIDSLS